MKFCVAQTAVASITLLIAAPVWSEEKPPDPKEIEYQTFQNAKLKLHAWSGKKVTFLTQNAGVDPNLMQELCTTFDGIYDFYFEATGKAPQQIKHYEGRLTVAEVNETCGAACGYLGATGVELSKGCFAELYNGYQKRKTIDQAPPYEFGRKFWFYHPQLAYQKSVSDRAIVTGYAVFMRIVSLDAAGAKLGPFRDKTGDESRKIMESLIDLYEVDPKFTWENTLKVDGAPPNLLGPNGTDLFASFCLRLVRDQGGRAFVNKLWKAAEKRPAAKSTQDAVDNFIIAASQAAGKDLSEQFTKWRWPLSEQGRAECAKSKLSS